MPGSPSLPFFPIPAAPVQPIPTRRFVQSIGSLFLSDSGNGAERLVSRKNIEGGEVGGESEKTPFSSFSIWPLFLHITSPPPPPPFSLVRFRETRFTRPNRRACSQASCTVGIVQCLLFFCITSFGDCNCPQHQETTGIRLKPS